MIRTNKGHRLTAFLTAVTGMLFGLGILTCAAQPLQGASQMVPQQLAPGQKNELTLDLEGETKKAALAIYRVGEWADAHEKLTLLSDYQSAEVTLWREMTGEDVRQASERLLAYADRENKEPAAQGVTEQGQLVFAGLSPGLYLIGQKSLTGQTCLVTPFLIYLPLQEKEGLSNRVTAFPKNEPIQEPTIAPEETTGGGGGGGGGGSSGGRRKTVAEAPASVLTDELVPLAPGPESPSETSPETILEPEIPLATLAKTGDSSGWGVLLAVNLIAMLGMIGVLSLREVRRKRM